MVRSDNQCGIVNSKHIRVLTLLKGRSGRSNQKLHWLLDILVHVLY